MLEGRHGWRPVIVVGLAGKVGAPVGTARAGKDRLPTGLVMFLCREACGRIMASGVYFRYACAIASRKAVAAILEPTALRWPMSEAYPSYSAKYPWLS